MANTSSAKKAARKITRRAAVNKIRRSRVRSFVRKVEEALAAGDKTAAEAAFNAAQPELMRAARQGRAAQEYGVAESFATRPEGQGTLRVNPIQLFSRYTKTRPQVGFFVCRAMTWRTLVAPLL